MMLPTPAAIAARNGTSSTLSRCWRSECTTGKSMCESAVVSPWPGKCFAVAKPPLSCTPRMNRVTNSATRCGSSPNERMLIMGFAGLLDIGVGRVYPLDSSGARFQSGDFAHDVGVVRISGGGESHGSREGCAFVEAHGGAAFEIRAN